MIRHFATLDRRKPICFVYMSNKEKITLASEIATIIAEGQSDWNEARKTIAEEFQIRSLSQLPKDEEIESALREHYAIFDPQGHASRLLELRKTALRAMKEVSDYKPVLTRGVLNGCADKYSDIFLLAECEDPKALEIELIDRGIEIEVLPNDRYGKNEHEEEIVFAAPLIRGGYFDKNHTTVWVRMKVFTDKAVLKNKGSKLPDQWQIKEEAAKTADIEALRQLIQLTENSD